MTQERPAHAKKALVIQEIAQKLTTNNGVAIAEYKNLTVAQMTTLRQEALKQGIEVKVYKDSLVRRAASENNLEPLNQFLTQQNVFIFSKEDGVAAPKLVAEFAKKNKALVLKAGIFEGKIQDTTAINNIASLPSKEELYSMFANSLLYPLRQVMSAIKAVANTKA